MRNGFLWKCWKFCATAFLHGVRGSMETGCRCCYKDCQIKILLVEMKVKENFINENKSRKTNWKTYTLD